MHIPKRVFVFVSTKRGPKSNERIVQIVVIFLCRKALFFGQCVFGNRGTDVQMMFPHICVSALEI